MTEDEKKIKLQQDDKMRCVHFLLQMFQKYGAEVKDKHKEKSEDKK